MDSIGDLRLRVDALAQGIAARIPIAVSEHAMWRAAERFPRFDTAMIEGEIRAAMAAGRITPDRGSVGLSSGSDPTCLYVWTLTGVRIYALRVDGESFVVTTTMRRHK